MIRETPIFEMYAHGSAKNESKGKNETIRATTANTKENVTNGKIRTLPKIPRYEAVPKQAIDTGNVATVQTTEVMTAETIPPESFPRRTEQRINRKFTAAV